MNNTLWHTDNTLPLYSYLRSQVILSRHCPKWKLNWARHILSLAKKLENVRIGTLEGLWHKMTSFEQSLGLLSVGWMA